MSMLDLQDQQQNLTGIRARLSADGPTTLIEIFEQVVADHPKRDTLNYKRADAWQSMSAAEMLKPANPIGAGLRSLCVRKGDRVAILSDSCVKWVLSDQGCIFLGALTVPIYPTLTPPQVSYILRDCSARAV